MADNYVQFSEMIDSLSPQELKWWEDEKQRVCGRLAMDGDCESGCVDFSIEKYGKEYYVWFSSDEWGNPDEVALTVQRFLKAHRPNSYFSLTWAETCSKPRIGEFGGGAVFVTANEISWLSTYQWVKKQIADLSVKK